MHITQSHPDFDTICWENWNPTDRATLCFLLRDHEVLLIEKKRGLGKGKINGPGGRFEPGETGVDCAIRETEEELGVTPFEPEERGVLRFEFQDGYRLQGHVFTARAWRGEAVETEEAVPRWTPLDAIPYPRMWADDVLWLPHMLAGKRFDGSFLFAGDRMLGVDLRIFED